MYQTPYHNIDLGKSSFLITGGAGFIGSNLVNYLLKYGALKVRVLDNLSTGFDRNLQEFNNNPSFEFIKGDICDLATCIKATEGIDYVLHHAALGSVPRSINDPIATNQTNVTGFLNMLVAVKDSGVKRMVYAASSSTYGDSTELPKVEERIGKPLSPYAVTKLVNELYADVFAKTYGIKTIGLRYFNVFGPKQDPGGAYAAVIPLFMQALQDGKPAIINGDGSQTRDFTFIENVVQANIKALLSEKEPAYPVYNVAFNARVSLNELWDTLKTLAGTDPGINFAPTRTGDVRDSLADISRIKDDLGYNPIFDLKQGLEITYSWFNKGRSNLKKHDYGND